MTDPRRPGRAVLAAGLTVLAVLVVLVGGVWPSQAYAADPPQLSMTVDDGQAAAQADGTSDYTVTVTNLGAKKVKDLVVTLRAPDGARIDSADDGTIKKGVASWTLDVRAGKSVEVGGSVAVPTSLPNDLLRFAVIACAAVSADDAPLVCASDSNLLPAGARAEQQQRELTPAAGAADRPGWLLPVAIGAVVLLAAGLVAALVLRDRRRRRSRLARQHARRPATTPQHLDGERSDASSFTHLRG